MQQSRARAIGSIVAAALAVVLLPLSVLGFWVRHTVADTPTWTAAWAPVIADDDFRGALTTAVTDEVTAAFEQSVPTSTSGGLLGDLEDMVTKALTEAVVSGVEAFMDSPACATLWRALGADAHAALIGILRDDPVPGGVLAVQDGMLVADTSAIARAAFTSVLEDTAPPETGDAGTAEVTESIDIMPVPNLAVTQAEYRVVEDLGVWGPLGVLVGGAAAVALAAKRGRALSLTAAAGAAVLALVGALVAVGRSAALAAAPTQPASGIVGGVVDGLLPPLWAVLGGTAVACLVLVAVGLGWSRRR